MVLDDIKIFNKALNLSDANALVILSNDDFNTNNLKFNLYPNPAKDILNIETSLEVEQVEIFNLFGQKVITTKELKIDVSSLPKAIYFVQIKSNNNQISTQKLIIK